MKKSLFTVVAILGLAVSSLVLSSCGAKATEGENAEAPAQKVVKAKSIGSLEDSLSYAYGVGLGDNLRQNFEQMPVDLNLDMFLKAFEQTLKGQDGKLRIKPEEAYQVFQHCMMAIMEQEAQNNKKMGVEYMAENAKKEGVVTTASGLQYEIITPAEGAKPVASDRVKVHYHGTLLDGTVFDSSIDRGTPAEFGVTQVIAGWQEGLQLMNVGSKVRFVIPSDLAYGDQGAGQMIAPGSTLIFEVELLEILK